MKASVKFSMDRITDEIDLEYYGHDESKSWNDLTESEQHEIEDSLREQNIILVSITGIN
jgi:hypothetical protein